MAYQTRTLAIIGGGSAGVTLFIAAVQHRVADAIYIFEPNLIGPGVAFSNTDDDILCNTSVDIMSVVIDNPLDFFDYLTAKGHKVTPKSFVPRKWVGEYLTERFRQHRVIARREGTIVIHVSSLFQSLQITAPHHYTLRFGSPQRPQSLAVTDVVFCTGFGTINVPSILKPYRDHPNFISNPYPEVEMLTKIPPQSRVLVIGSKLSAIDATLLLCREGHQVTMLSPSGELPAVRAYCIKSTRAIFEPEIMASIMMRQTHQTPRALTPALKHTYFKYFIRALYGNTKKTWRKEFSFVSHYRDRLYEEIKIAEQYKSQWQDVTVHFVNIVNEICQTDEKNFDCSFHPDFKTMYSRYITAIALPNARKLLRYIDEGYFVINKGRIVNISAPTSKRGMWQVDGGTGYQHFNTVINATGYHLPYFVFDAAGKLQIDVHGRQAKNAISILPSMAASHPSFKEKESIWFIGMPAHVCLQIPNATFVVTLLADRVINNMIELPLV